MDCPKISATGGTSGSIISAAHVGRGGGGRSGGSAGACCARGELSVSDRTCFGVFMCSELHCCRRPSSFRLVSLHRSAERCSRTRGTSVQFVL